MRAYEWFRASMCPDVNVEVCLLEKALVAIDYAALVPFALSLVVSVVFLLTQYVRT